MDARILPVISFHHLFLCHNYYLWLFLDVHFMLPQLFPPPLWDQRPIFPRSPLDPTHGESSPWSPPCKYCQISLLLDINARNASMHNIRQLTFTKTCFAHPILTHLGFNLEQRRDRCYFGLLRAYVQILKLPIISASIEITLTEEI
ncbi:hypothetical protein ACJX0J_038051 [Zea mays]